MFSPIDLLQFFQKNSGRFTNKHNVTFEMINQDYFRISAPVPTNLNDGLSLPMRIEIKHFGLYDLYNTHHIYSLNNLKNKIDFGTLHDLYCEAGRGEVIAEMTEYLSWSYMRPVEIHFEYRPEEIDRVKVSIPILNYCEIMEDGIYSFEDYVEYVQKNIHLFEFLLRNRSNILFSKNLGQDEYKN